MRGRVSGLNLIPVRTEICQFLSRENKSLNLINALELREKCAGNVVNKTRRSSSDVLRVSLVVDFKAETA